MLFLRNVLRVTIHEMPKFVQEVQHTRELISARNM